MKSPFWLQLPCSSCHNNFTPTNNQCACLELRAPSQIKIAYVSQVTNYEKLFENRTLSDDSNEDDVMPTGSSQGKLGFTRCLCFT